jgi:hypothetical protein
LGKKKVLCMYHTENRDWRLASCYRIACSWTQMMHLPKPSSLHWMFLTHTHTHLCQNKMSPNLPPQFPLVVTSGTLCVPVFQWNCV